jgi:hypothetical protein
VPPFYSDDAVTIWHGNALDLPLDDESVDLVCTSPPYFGLRAYADSGETYAGQIGSEATPGEFLDALAAATREMARVLKPSGSIFVNLGDKYAGSAGGSSNGGASSGLRGNGHVGGGPSKAALRAGGRIPIDSGDIPAKSLMLLPERYRIRCVDDLGLIARAVIVWSKCLSGGTVVYARTNGRDRAIRLHDLCRAYQPEDVQLWTGEKWSQVKAWEPTPRGDAQYELELRSGERIGCTPEHRWPTSRGLLSSDAIQVGDVLDTCTLPEGEAAPAALDDEMIGWFVGLYIAEGSRSEQTIQFAGHVKELERFKRLSEIAAAFHGTAKVHATGGNSATINVTGAMLRAILETYVGGRTAKDKYLAPKCWTRSNRFLRAVLDGYLSGDGHWREDAHRWIVGFTDNDALAADLRTLGARLGLSVRLQRCTHTGFGQEWPGWRGSITEQWRRRQPDSEVVAIRPSRARQFWDVAIEDEPHLFALASGVLTHNSNGLPESVRDRVRRSHEDWVHLTKEPRYFTGIDEIREPHEHHRRDAWDRRPEIEHGIRPTGNVDARLGNNPLGKLPGSVWTIPTQPLRVPPELGIDHFAAFPMEWPRRIIRGWSPSGICVECGEGRRPVSEDLGLTAASWGAERIAGTTGTYENSQRHGSQGSTLGFQRTRSITGYACACDAPTAPTRPAVILDPFGGTGTTGVVAKALGRRAHLVDLSRDYCSLAQWRVNDPKELAKAGQVKAAKKAKVTKMRPKPVEPEQGSLLDDPAA